MHQVRSIKDALNRQCHPLDANNDGSLWCKAERASLCALSHTLPCQQKGDEGLNLQPLSICTPWHRAVRRKKNSVIPVFRKPCSAQPNIYLPLLIVVHAFSRISSAGTATQPSRTSHRVNRTFSPRTVQIRGRVGLFDVQAKVGSRMKE